MPVRFHTQYIISLLPDLIDYAAEKFGACSPCRAVIAAQHISVGAGRKAVNPLGAGEQYVVPHIGCHLIGFR